MFGGGGRSRNVKFRGEDYQAELHLTMKDVSVTHQQTMKVDGKDIRITIYAGVEDGQKIRLKGYGGQGINGGPNGDLYITFRIEPDAQFKREGANLYTSTELDLYVAVLGGEITLDTLTGKIKLKVPPETQNGTRVRLKGKGLPVYKKDGEYGDLYVTYQVRIPTSLSEKEKQLFQELSKLR